MENSKKTPGLSLRVRRVASLCVIMGFVLALAAVFLFAGKPLIDFVSDTEQFRGWVADNGFWACLAFVGMMALQIVVAFIPGEPLEMAAGYAFGTWLGLGLCLLGATIGGVAVFLLVRMFGTRVIEPFCSHEKLMSMKFLRNSKRVNLLAFVLFLIPGTPKDAITYVIGLTDMKLWIWALITGVARTPSVVTSTLCGDMVGAGNYIVAGAVLIGTLVIALGGLLVYRRLSGRAA